MSKDNLSWDDLEVIYSSLPRPIVGIVCRSDAIGAVRWLAKVGDQTNRAVTRLGSDIPLYEKAGQIEPWRAFYDEAELREYLKPDIHP